MAFEAVLFVASGLRESGAGGASRPLRGQSLNFVLSALCHF